MKKKSTLTEVLPCFFLSYKVKARVQLAKTGHGPHCSQLGDNFVYAISSPLILVLRLWVRIPESLPAKVVNCVVLCIVCVCVCVLHYCHRLSTQLQLTNTSINRLPIKLYCLSEKSLLIHTSQAVIIYHVLILIYCMQI